MSKPRFRLHYDPTVAATPEKYPWWYITLPDGRNTCRCRTPAEIFKRSERLRAYKLAWEKEDGDKAKRDDGPGQLPQQG